MSNHDGFLKLAHGTGIPLVGGNLARSPGPLVINVTVIGAARRRRVLTRAGGRHGDELYVTGSLGAAATGLAICESGVDRGALDPTLGECLGRYEWPQPRLRLGISVARNRAASACVDLSDGLADAVSQLAGASGTGAVVEASRLPIHPGTIAWAATRGQHAVPQAVSGGEDYELLFAVPARRRAAFRAAARSQPDVTVTHIGRLSRDTGVWLDRDGRLEPLGRGFSHF